MLKNVSALFTTQNMDIWKYSIILSSRSWISWTFSPKVKLSMHNFKKILNMLAPFSVEIGEKDMNTSKLRC